MMGQSNVSVYWQELVEKEKTKEFRRTNRPEISEKGATLKDLMLVLLEAFEALIVKDNALVEEMLEEVCNGKFEKKFICM